MAKEPEVDPLQALAEYVDSIETLFISHSKELDNLTSDLEKLRKRVAELEDAKHQ